MFSSCQKNITEFTTNQSKKKIKIKKILKEKDIITEDIKHYNRKRKNLGFTDFFCPASVSQKRDLINAGLL